MSLNILENKYMQASIRVPHTGTLLLPVHTDIEQSRWCFCLRLLKRNLNRKETQSEAVQYPGPLSPLFLGTAMAQQQLYSYM